MTIANPIHETNLRIYIMQLNVFFDMTWRLTQSVLDDKFISVS